MIQSTISEQHENMVSDHHLISIHVPKLHYLIGKKVGCNFGSLNKVSDDEKYQILCFQLFFQ